MLCMYICAVAVTGIGPVFYDTCVIGNFDEAHARQFLETQLEDAAASLTDEVWPQIYNVSSHAPFATSLHDHM